MAKLATKNLKLNFFEVGYLYGALKKSGDLDSKEFPRSLWLKLHIASAEAYLDHETLGEQAKKDIIKYEDELRELEKDLY